MANVSSALVALSDQTRRLIFERLSAGSMAVAEVARTVPVSRPAVSQHLKVLKAAGLVRDEVDGTRRIYRIDPAGLGPLRAWLDQHWDRALAAFQTLAEQDPSS